VYLEVLWAVSVVVDMGFDELLPAGTLADTEVELGVTHTP